MFKALVWLQWKSSRAWILAAGLAVVALPVMSVVREWPKDGNAMAQFLSRLDAWSLFYPAAATALGIAMATLAWRADRRAGFVYALSLPIERWRQVAYRYGAGAVWVLAIAAALWITALVVVATTSVPPSLRGYPNGLAVKFALATISVFTLGFAILALPDRLKRGLAWATLLVVAVQVAALFAGVETNWLAAFLETVVGPTGPLGMLGGRWMLIDV